MLISFLIPSILFEYGGKRNSHHIKNHGTTYIRIKEKGEEKEESVYNTFFVFYEFFLKTVFLQTCLSSNTTQRLINNNVQKCSKRFKNIQGERIIYYEL